MEAFLLSEAYRRGWTETQSDPPGSAWQDFPHCGADAGTLSSMKEITVCSEITLTWSGSYVISYYHVSHLRPNATYCLNLKCPTETPGWKPTPQAWLHWELVESLGDAPSGRQLGHSGY